MRRVLFASSVGGGPLARLVPHLQERGVDAEVVEMFSPEEWRELMAAGPSGRLWARLSSNILFPLKVSWRAMCEPGHIWVPTTNPFSLPWVLVASRWLHGNKVVPLVYDLYPDALEASGLLTQQSWASRFAVQANKFWFAKADGVAFIGDAMRQHSISRYGEPRHHEVIETGADIRELKAPGSRAELVISYVGNMGAMHDWQTLADALAHVDEELHQANVKVVFAASGGGAESLRKALGSCKVITFKPPLSDDDWRELMRKTSIALVTLKQSADMTCVPSKTFSAMAAGSAVVAVAPRGSDLFQLVERHGCGGAVEPGCPDALATLIKHLTSQPEVLQNAQRNAVSAAAQCYDMPALAGKWQSLLLRTQAPAAGPGYSVPKRCLDLGASVVALGILTPALFGASAAVLASMGRPILFKQERPGLHGKPFKLLKFRTMRHATPGQEGPDFDAARLTRLGKFLRATSIDELPSLINVLRGEMSLVGPRPLLMRYLPRYTKEQAVRHAVKPGITGWAQVNGRNALTWEKKFALDVWYARNQSLRLDLAILARTVASVIKREGISQQGHATMPEFMGTEQSK